MLIHEFHSKLALCIDRSPLFEALRHLRLADNLKSFADEAAGWPVWTDSTQDPDDGGSFRLASTMA